LGFDPRQAAQIVEVKLEEIETRSNNSNGPLLYVWGWADYLFSYRMVDDQFLTAPSAQSSFRTGFPGGILALSANGSIPGTGILWVTRVNTDGLAGAGVLHAFDASDISKELWNREQNSARDRLGAFAKFNTPTVANGKVYVGTFSKQLVVYGLLNAGVKASVSPTATEGNGYENRTE